MEYPLVAIDGIYRRLIPSKWPTVDVYARLESEKLKRVAIKLEELTNPRLAVKARITGGDLSAEPSSPKLQNWNAAPFSYPMPEGTHVLPPPYSVMELANSIPGALARAILRREDFLSRTDEPACGLDMRMLSNRVVGTFYDLRSLPLDTTQAALWLIGRKLYEKGATGVLFKLAEVPHAEFISVFDCDALPEKAVQGAHYRFAWNGKQIARLYDFSKDVDIERADIFSSTKAAA